MLKHFDNQPFWLGDIPKELLIKLKEECFNFEKAQEIITGVSEKGTPKHYKLEKNREEFQKFVGEQMKLYETQTNYLKFFRFVTSIPKFAFGTTWINIQKKGEFIPWHTHDGVYSYSAWINIPDSFNTGSIQGAFDFMYNDILGKSRQYRINLDKSFEGKLIMFPSLLPHIVYPFSDTEQLRISVSGNIFLHTE